MSLKNIYDICASYMRTLIFNENNTPEVMDQNFRFDWIGMMMASYHRLTPAMGNCAILCMPVVYGGIF